MKHIQSSKSKSTLSNVKEEDIQPNAVDLRLDKVLKVRDDAFVLTDE